jgi:iron complex transport system ATP-binding protein
MTSSQAPVLEARHASFRVGAKALVDGVDLRIEAGELVALVGPNGAGKSTLCSLLSGDLRPTAGAVHLDGLELTGYSPGELARRRAVLPQKSMLAFPFPVREVVLMGRYPHLARWRAPGPADRAIARQAMRDADVMELADRAFTTLSGGEQTRVALARVLAQDVPVLLLDEPTTALDLRHQHDVLRVCRRLADQGAAVLVVLHDLGLASAWADRVGVLRAGRLVACGRPHDVLSPELVVDVFAQPVTVVEHPDERWPVVLPATGRVYQGSVGGGRQSPPPPLTGAHAHPETSINSRR